MTSKPDPASAVGVAAEPLLRIRAHDLSKTYRLYDAPWHRLAELLTRSKRHQEHQALEGIGFELRAGETLGVVGQNGAGKSTLLKLLAGVLQPTRGRLEVNGTISSILELGAGFHPDFTGRQNIRINAAMLGLDERRLAARLPAIEDFCELGGFLDQPVKVYSSGMSMRLAFAIATQVEPDILIIDEALSVGDGYFQKKCLDRILELIENGTALLFCSHAMYYLSTLCQRVLWLRDGEVAAYGETDHVIGRYEEFLLSQQAYGQSDSGGSSPPKAESAVRLVEAREQQNARITAVDLSCDGRQMLPEEGLRCGQDLTVEVAWNNTDPATQFQIGLGFNRLDGTEVFGIDSRSSDLKLSGLGVQRVRFDIRDQPLLRGQYTVHAFLLDERALHVYDHRVLHDAFRVAPHRDYQFGMIRVPHQVSLVSDAP